MSVPAGRTAVAPGATLALRGLAQLDVSAASGLVLHGGLLHVVADDALRLHRYTPSGEPAGAIDLLGGELPAEARARKAAKPDFEALCALPGGALLALGSGSTPRRRRGCLVAGDSVREVSLAALYAELEGVLGTPNVEGAALLGSRLLLAHRGHAESPESALIVLDAAHALESLLAGELAAAAIIDVVRLLAGSIAGVPAGITDLAPAPDGGLWFTAAAEATRNAYDDGQCAGSLLGALDERLRVSWRATLAPVAKIEGLCHLRREAGADVWRLVADADDPQVPAQLFELRVPLAAAASSS